VVLLEQLEQRDPKEVRVKLGQRDCLERLDDPESQELLVARDLVEILAVKDLLDLVVLLDLPVLLEHQGLLVRGETMVSLEHRD